MDETRKAILSFDENLKVLKTHFDEKTSTLLKTLIEQMDQIEKRWSQLIDHLEECSSQVKKKSFLLLSSHHVSFGLVEQIVDEFQQ